MELVGRDICLDGVTCFHAELCMGTGLILPSRFNLVLDRIREMLQAKSLTKIPPRQFCCGILTSLSKTGDYFFCYIRLFFFFFSSLFFFFSISFDIGFEFNVMFSCNLKNLVLSLLSQSCVIFWLFKSVDQDSWQEAENKEV